MKSLFLAILSVPFLFSPIKSEDDSGLYYQTTETPSFGSKYDYQTGNSYNWSTNYSGDTNVNGYNTRTGSTWQTTIQDNGNMRGHDNDGNYWNYNKGSDSYYNYGTGETRYGNYYYNPGRKK